MTVWADAWNAGRAQAAARRRQRTTSALAYIVTILATFVPRWSRFRSATLQLAGLVVLDVAAWRWAALAGLVAIGVSLFVLEWLTSE